MNTATKIFSAAMGVLWIAVFWSWYDEAMKPAPLPPGIYCIDVRTGTTNVDQAPALNKCFDQAASFGDAAILPEGEIDISTPMVIHSVMFSANDRAVTLHWKRTHD
jgi:hypothetical protein